jgi:ATP-binding cassette subfamily B protein
MHLGYFHDKQTGDLMSRIVNDTRDFELLYAHLIPESITNLVTFAGVLIVLLTINWKLALITCAPLPLIFASGFVFSRKVRPYFRISQKKMGELNGKLQDNLSGIHEIQSFGREAYETEQVNTRNFEHIRAMLQALKISAVFHPSVEFISSLGTVLVVGFGGYRGLPPVSGPLLCACDRPGQSVGEYAAIHGRCRTCSGYSGCAAGNPGPGRR